MKKYFLLILPTFLLVLSSCEKAPIAAISIFPDADFGIYYTGQTLFVKNESINAVQPKIYYNGELIGEDSANINLTGDDWSFERQTITIEVMSPSGAYQDESSVSFYVY